MVTDDAQDILEAFASWRSDGLTPLTTIYGYANLLLSNQIGAVSDAQRDCLQVVRDSASRAIDSWHYPSLYLQLRYGELDLTWEAASLSAILHDVLLSLDSTSARAPISIDVPETLPAIRGSQSLLAVFRVFFAPHLLSRDTNQPVNVRATPGATSANIVIVGGYTNVYHAIQESQQPFWMGSPLDTAQRIIHKHRGLLDVHTEADNVVFRFSLPYWRE
jgi:light-regulated signal transduction histidine kinase (bacteriophytochrome)